MSKQSLGRVTEICHDIWLRPDKNNSFHEDLPAFMTNLVTNVTIDLLVTVVSKVPNIIVVTVVTSASNSYSLLWLPERIIDVSSADGSYLVTVLSHPRISMRSVGHVSQI